MRQASGEFAEDPCSSVKRGNMVRAARALLSAVTHLLVLADMSDVYKLLLQLKLVRWLHPSACYTLQTGLIVISENKIFPLNKKNTFQQQQYYQLMYISTAYYQPDTMDDRIKVLI